MIWLELTDTRTKNKRLVNASHIIAINELEEGCSIMLHYNDSVVVDESFEDIRDCLKLSAGWKSFGAQLLYGTL